ncbi:hypothetical protein [Marinobacter sp. LV10R520-4]|uniref:hypothetical protein n=1 Tax=Marinobacter sp. LV10R520-4 TaxID=1761796 RepID=UPI00117DB730
MSSFRSFWTWPVATSKNITLPTSSCRIAGEALGIPGQTFDKILVSAAAEELPSELTQQLNPGGIMVIPIQNNMVVILSARMAALSRAISLAFVSCLLFPECRHRLLPCGVGKAFPLRNLWL